MYNHENISLRPYAYHSLYHCVSLLYLNPRDLLKAWEPRHRTLRIVVYLSDGFFLLCCVKSLLYSRRLYKVMLANMVSVF